MDPDTELMLKFAKGDISAFEQILNKYKKRIVNFAYRFIQDQEEAEDIAQEVFLKVHLSARKYKPKAKLLTWLFRITANLCLNKLRGQNHFQILSLNETSHGAIAKAIQDIGSGSPYSNLVKNELTHIVRKAINSLPPRQRMAVILQRYESLSYREISKILGCSRAAVDSLLQRAKQSLRKDLSPFFEKNR